MISITQKSDLWGATASSLCLIHCLATPFIFIAQTCTAACCAGTPTWWQFIDYFFLVISFFAIYRSAQTTTINWMKPALWLSWVALLFVIINEKFEWFYVKEILNYVPAITLMVLHLYNRKYCQCKTDNCCTNEG